SISSSGNGGPLSFQAILYASGKIVFQYLNMKPPTNSATIGIQNADRRDGLLVAFNRTYVHDHLAIRIRTGPQWFEVSPALGSVAAGTTTDLTLALDTAGLEAGSYHGSVLLRTNDAEHPDITVPVDLQVVDSAPLVAATGALRFELLENPMRSRVRIALDLPRRELVDVGGYHASGHGRRRGPEG